MIYRDSVYGEINIQEPVILELIGSAPVERLHKISQHGPSVYNKYYDKKIITRFEHSIGTYVLLNRLQVSLEEQIAGLFHDVGHTVFSHTVDFLFPEENHEYDKKFHKDLVEGSEIPSILKKFKIDMDKVLDEKNFPILEKELPNLCADRVDYFLRDPFLPKDFDKKLILDNLASFDSNLVFTNSKSALYFSKQYLKMHDLFWANPLDELLYFLMVDVLKIAFDKNLIGHKDLFLNEEEFLIKIRKIKNKYMEEKLELIRDMKREQVRVSQFEIPNSYFVKSKIRVIDPFVLVDRKLVKLSDIDQDYKKFKLGFVQKTPKERWIGYET